MNRLIRSPLRLFAVATFALSKLCAASEAIPIKRGECNWKEYEEPLLAITAADQSTRSDLRKLYQEFSARRLNDRLPVEDGRPAATPEEKAQWLAASKALWAADKAGQELVFPLLLRCGWPDSKVIAPRAADAAWLVLQHASLKSQLEFRNMAEQAVRERRLPPQQFALLVDRLLVRQGKPQIYGSQLSSETVDGTLRTVLLPIEDPANLDSRRMSVGLSSICEYLRGFGDVKPEEVHPPCKVSEAKK
jgi:hypothetical protein